MNKIAVKLLVEKCFVPMQRKVGREEEGSCSNRLELAAIVLALRGTPVTNPMLYLCDNQALLKAVKRWVGEGE